MRLVDYGNTIELTACLGGLRRSLRMPPGRRLTVRAKVHAKRLLAAAWRAR